MNTLFRVALISALLGLSSCTPFQYRIVEKHDEFQNSDLVFMTNNQIVYSGIKFHIQFNLVKSIKNGDKVDLFANIIYLNEDWLFIDDTMPASLLIDGERVDLGPADTPVDRDAGNGLITETVLISIDETLIARLITAKELKIRLHGKRNADAVFQKENIDRMRSFYHTYIKKSTHTI